MAKQRTPEQYAREVETAVQDALYNIADNVSEAIQEALGTVQDVSQATVKDIEKGLRDIAKINTVMAKAHLSATQGQFGYAKASKIILDRRAKERSLQNAINIAKTNGLQIDKKTQEELARMVEANKTIESSLKQQVKASNRINKAQGVSGVLLGGLQKLTSKAGLGGLSDVFADAKGAAATLADEMTDGGAKSVGFLGKSKIAAKGLGVAFKGVAGYLAGPAGIAMLLGKAVKFLLEADKRAAGIAQSMNMTKTEAANFNREILKASANTGYLYTRLGEAAELAGKFADSTGIIAKNIEVFNADLGIVNRRFSLSDTQTAEMAKNMIIVGRSSTDFASAALGGAEALEMQTGINIQNQAIMRDIADLTADQTLSLGMQPELLGRAAAQARRFGLSMSLLEGISGNLLNFEESISSELEAELILGRQLNLQRARQAALNGDYAEVAAEIAKEMGSAAEYERLNLYEREALAKSLGMSRQDLAKALKEQLALEKAGYASAEDRERKYQQYLAAGLSEKEALAKIGMEEFTMMKQNISFQEMLNNLLHNMKIIFMDSINPALQEATEYLMQNPSIIDDTVTAIKKAAIAVSEFITELQNGDSIIDKMAVNFKFIGEVLNQAMTPLKALGALAAGEFKEAGSLAFKSNPFSQASAFYDIINERNRGIRAIEAEGELNRNAKSIANVIDSSNKRREEWLKSQGYSDQEIKNMDDRQESIAVLKEIKQLLQQGNKIYVDGQELGNVMARSAAGSI